MVNVVYTTTIVFTDVLDMENIPLFGPRMLSRPYFRVTSRESYSFHFSGHVFLCTISARFARAFHSRALCPRSSSPNTVCMRCSCVKEKVRCPMPPRSHHLNNSQRCRGQRSPCLAVFSGGSFLPNGPLSQ